MFGCPDENQLDLARLGRPVGLLAGPPGGLRLAHRHAGAVHSQVHGRSRRRLAFDRLATLQRGDLATECLRAALDLLGADLHAGEFVQQPAGLRKAGQGRGRADHARHGGRQAGAGHAQRRVARAETLAAGAAVIVGPLQCHCPQARLEGLGASSGVARRLPAGARRGRAPVVLAVGIQALFDGPGGQLQSVPPHMGLDRLEVERVGRSRRYEAIDLGFDGGAEQRHAGFFLGITDLSAQSADKVGLGDDILHIGVRGN